MSLTADVMKDVRARLNWTQQEMADRLGVSRSQISNIEAGRGDTMAGPLLQLLIHIGWKAAQTTDRLSAFPVATSIKIIKIARCENCGNRLYDDSSGWMHTDSLSELCYQRSVRLYPPG